MKYVYYLISSSMIFLVFSMPVQSQQGAHDLGSGKESVYTLERIVVTAAKIDEYIKNHPRILAISCRTVIIVKPMES